jgi:hypothetical protein
MFSTLVKGDVSHDAMVLSISGLIIYQACKEKENDW